MSIYKLYYNIYETSVVLYVLYIKYDTKIHYFYKNKVYLLYDRYHVVYFYKKDYFTFKNLSYRTKTVHRDKIFVACKKLYSGTKVIQQEKDVQWEKICTAGQKLYSGTKYVQRDNAVYSVQDGHIDFREFMIVLYIMSSGSPEENLQQIFR